MTPVILSGGVGSRLWPMSRGMYPKQLLPLLDPKISMLQQTLQRVAGVCDAKPSIIVCNDEHRFIVGEQVQQIGIQDATIMLEPEGKNTAPAVALAAFNAVKDNPDELLLVLPADHAIADLNRFKVAVKKAASIAEQGRLVALGVAPQSPETGYGYIRAGAADGDAGFVVDGFKEKPDIETARKYLASGDYLWNAGIFIFSAATYLEELGKFEPDVFKACENAVTGLKPDLDFTRIDEAAFALSPAVSVDYAVMEKTDKASVVLLDAGWNDVGSWSALWDVSEKDELGNASHGDVLLHDTASSYVYAESKLVSAIGVSNLVIIETDDAVLVANKAHAQRVKEVVNKLKFLERSQIEHHRKVYRPWGWYDLIDVSQRFQVKRIQVKPGAKLSLQKHDHRAEHWVVVKGVAQVVLGEKTLALQENESTYIPIGVKHSLGNPSDSELLEIIEVQSGDYLGEDDIVRFDDEYGRS